MALNHRSFRIFFLIYCQPAGQNTWKKLCKSNFSQGNHRTLMMFFFYFDYANQITFKNMNTEFKMKANWWLVTNFYVNKQTNKQRSKQMEPNAKIHSVTNTLRRTFVTTFKFSTSIFKAHNIHWYKTHRNKWIYSCTNDVNKMFIVKYLHNKLCMKWSC